MLTIIVFSLFLGVAMVTGSKHCENIQSAFTIGDMTYLAIDRRVIKMAYLGSVADDTNMPIPVKIFGQTAATELPALHKYMLISTNKDQVFFENGTSIPGEHILPANVVDTIDAAATRGKDIFLFSGERFRTMPYVGESAGTLSEAHPMSELGLPNHVDAAWQDNTLHATMVLKGDQLYVSANENSFHFFDGPLTFEHFFHISMLDLCTKR